MSEATKTLTSNISDTVWPARAVPEPVKKVISLLLQLLDDKSDDAGLRLADEVFTSGGHLGAAHKSAKGSAGEILLVSCKPLRRLNRSFNWDRLFAPPVINASFLIKDYHRNS